MKRSSSFSIYREDQPSEAAWNAVKAYAQRWNRTNETQMQLVFGEFFRLASIDHASKAYATLRAGLAQLEQKTGVRFTEIVDETAEAADLASADFIGVQGVSLDGLGAKPFSSDGNMGPMLPCSRCGSADPWSRERRAPFVIQESLLKGRAQLSGDIYMPSKDGWDFVNLPAGGGMAVSMRAIQWMHELAATGFETLPLVSARTHHTSKRMVELAATHSFVMPCLRHSDEPLSICPVCGTVLSGALREGWSIQRCQVGELSVWSHHRFRVNSMYFARSLYDALTSRGAQGLATTGFVAVCDHPCPDAGA